MEGDSGSGSDRSGAASGEREWRDLCAAWRCVTASWLQGFVIPPLCVLLQLAQRGGAAAAGLPPPAASATASLHSLATLRHPAALQPAAQHGE